MCPVWDEKRWFTAAMGRAYAQLQYAILGLLPSHNPFRLMELGVDPLGFVPGAAWNQAVNPLRQELTAVPPRPVPLVYTRRSTRHTDVPAPPPFRTAAPHAEAIVPVPRAKATASTPRAEAVVPAPRAKATAPTPRAEAIVPAPRAKATAPAPRAEAIAQAPRANAIAPASRADAVVPAPHADNRNTQLSDDLGFADTVDSGNTVNIADDLDSVITVNDRKAVKTAANLNASEKHLVRDIMEPLRVDHDCQHTTWMCRSGGGICGSCVEYLPIYLFVSPSSFFLPPCLPT